MITCSTRESATAMAAAAASASSASNSTMAHTTTPNARSAWPAIEWTLDRLRLVPTLDEAQHLTLFTRQTLRRACDRAGWDVADIGTFNGVAPFVAVVSEGLAAGAERLEFLTRRMLPWNLLYCLARRR